MADGFGPRDRAGRAPWVAPPENDQAMEYKDDYLVDEREAEMEEWRAHIDHWHGDDASVYHVQGSSFARHLPPSF